MMDRIRGYTTQILLNNESPHDVKNVMKNEDSLKMK